MHTPKLQYTLHGKMALLCFNINAAKLQTND